MNKMSSSSEEEAVVVALYYLRKKRRRRFWVHPYITNNAHRTTFICARELLLCDEKKFQSFYRMSKETFKLLVSITGPAIQKVDTHYRRSVSAEERLLITLR